MTEQSDERVLLEDPDGAPYPEAVQVFARDVGAAFGAPLYSDADDWSDFYVAALESVAQHHLEPDKEDDQPAELPETGVEKLLQANWEVFRTHRPAGAYLPVGQLDGDCWRCHGPWPCETVLKVFALGKAGDRS